MCTTDLSLVFMMTDMLNPLSTSPNFFVKQRLDKLEHPSIITKWIHNMDTDTYMEQLRFMFKEERNQSYLKHGAFARNH